MSTIERLDTPIIGPSAGATPADAPNNKNNVIALRLTAVPAYLFLTQGFTAWEWPRAAVLVADWAELTEG